MKVLGIDPGIAKGAEGGLVLVECGDVLGVTHLRVMPTVRVKGGRQALDESELERALREWEPEHVYIESPLAMPGQSPAATGSRFGGVGFVRGLARGLGIAYTEVHPKTWQKEMFRGLPEGGDTKSLAYLACSRLWPHIDWRRSERAQGPHTGLCDAALIGEYGVRQLGGRR